MIQNGANSAVGTAAIQICREWGVKTINLIRDRCALACLAFVRTDSSMCAERMQTR